MVKGDGDRLTHEYFSLIETILDARDLSARKVSRLIGRSHPYFSRLKRRKQLSRSWEVVEEGLGISPRTLLSVIAEDVEYHQVLQAFGPQGDPLKPEEIEATNRLLDRIQSSPAARSGTVEAETWRGLERLEWQRFKQRDAAEVEASRIVLGAAKAQDLSRDQAVLAVGALGIWSTIRRHANDPGSARQGLTLAIRAAATLRVENLLARQLQRSMYLLCDVDQYRQATFMAEAAAKLYSDIGDSAGLGAALIDTGFAAFGARDLEKAEARVLLGAGLLESSPIDQINKASAYQLAAKSSSIRGNLSEACQYLDQAAKYATVYEPHWAAIRWCAGSIQAQLGRLDTAESALREALAFYIEADRVTDIVMLLLELAMILAAEKRVDEVPALAKYLRPYLARLTEKDQVKNHVEEAYACLLRARHQQALERFKSSYEAAWRRGFATP